MDAVEQELLDAAAQGDGLINVTASTITAGGWVKTWDTITTPAHEFAGLVEAVQRLHRRGYLQPVDQEQYRLTPEGRRHAKTS
jgi:hypothetical protein